MVVAAVNYWRLLHSNQYTCKRSRTLVAAVYAVIHKQVCLWQRYASCSRTDYMSLNCRKPERAGQVEVPTTSLWTQMQRSHGQAAQLADRPIHKRGQQGAPS